MSRYTRFPNRGSQYDTALPTNREEQTADAERLFRYKSVRPLTRDERTTQVAKQIVKEESEKRRTLSETLRTARLERAGRFTRNARNERGSKPDQ